MTCDTCYDTLTIDTGGKVVRCPDCKPECVANSDTSKGPEVPLWECPCAFCTKMDWEALDDERPTLRAFRIESFPESWPDLRKETAS